MKDFPLKLTVINKCSFPLSQIITINENSSVHWPFQVIYFLSHFITCTNRESAFFIRVDYSASIRHPCRMLSSSMSGDYFWGIFGRCFHIHAQFNRSVLQKVRHNCEMLCETEWWDNWNSFLPFPAFVLSNAHKNTATIRRKTINQN